MKKKYLFILLVFLILCLWAYIQPYDYGPDEYMRYKIPLYIYNHNKLPLPNDSEVVVEYFNASYAYYSTFLPSIFSALSMKLFSLFSTKAKILLFASRFVNVICGTIFVYFYINIVDILFEDKKIKVLSILLCSLWPQFLFLNSYVNNDSMALMSTSIIVYSWLLLQEKYNIKRFMLMSLGIIICSLSYYNAYGFILCSIFIFISLFITNKKFDKKNFIKYATFCTVIICLFICYFFIRNAVVNNGDFIGIKSFLNACEQSKFEEIRPSLRNTPQHMKLSIIELLFTNKYGHGYFLVSSYMSYIAKFGYSKYNISYLSYIFYTILFLLAFIGNIKNLKNIKLNKENAIFLISLIICTVIPFLLSVKYSYSTDYQPQGRYLFPSFICVLLFITNGVSNLIKKNKFIYIVLIIGILYVFVDSNIVLISSILRS